MLTLTRFLVSNYSLVRPTVYYTRGSKHYATDAVLKNIRARLCKL
jgi:hypothetical protein